MSLQFLNSILVIVDKSQKQIRVLVAGKLFPTILLTVLST